MSCCILTWSRFSLISRQILELGSFDKLSVLKFQSRRSYYGL